MRKLTFYFFSLRLLVNKHKHTSFAIVLDLVYSNVNYLFFGIAQTNIYKKESKNYPTNAT